MLYVGLGLDGMDWIGSQTTSTARAPLQRAVLITLRTVGNTQYVDLVDNAIRVRKNAVAPNVQEASGYDADKAAVDLVLRVLSTCLIDWWFSNYMKQFI